MESAASHWQKLENIRQFLRAEGFYAAEEALASEIENRCPEGSSPTGSAQDLHRAAQAGYFSLPTSPPAKRSQGYQQTSSRRSSQGDPEGWREEIYGSGGHEDHGTLEQLYNQVQSDSRTAQNMPSTWKRPTASHGDRNKEIDEYTDEDDMGYVREYIRGQAAFRAMELSYNDDAHEAMRLYHQARASQDGFQEKSDHDGASSTGRASSLISAGGPEHANSTPYSQTSHSSKDRIDDDRLVTITEPVNAKSTAASPSSYIVGPNAATPTSADSAPQTPKKQIGIGTGICPESHPISHISSEFSVDSPLYHEPSLSADIGKVDAEEEVSSKPSGGGWGRMYLDMLGRVLGRRGSAADSSAEGSSDGPMRSSKAVQALNFGFDNTPNSSAADHAGEGRESELEEGEVDQTRVSVSHPGPDGPTPQAAVPAKRTSSSKGNVASLSPAADADAGPLTGESLETPKSVALGAAGEDAAFSFPVTPASEPPAATEPGDVFKAWPSFRKSTSRHLKQGHSGRDSSEYEASVDYSTDDGYPARISDRGSGHNTSSPNTGRSDVCPAAQEGYEPLEAQPTSKQPKKSPLSIQPLDTSVSLPPKMAGLDLRPQSNGSSYDPDHQEGNLQAYQPTREGPADDTEDLSNRSGDLTVRTMETGRAAGGGECTAPPSIADDNSSVTFRWDANAQLQRYEILNLPIYHPRFKTGFEESKDIVFRSDDLVAGRFRVTASLGSAAFSQAIQAYDLKENKLVCLKVIKNNKDYMDQSLDEIKLLKYVNMHDPNDEHNILRMDEYFYYKEHLFLVCELLRANLYEFQKYNREQGEEPYFTLPRVQSIARQVLRSLAFMHSLNLIHCDLKPENILIKSYSRCEVKVIDLGSSCFTTDSMSSYVQSRSYRAPEVILGLPYHQTVDIWSLGCILAELLSGYVLFQNESLATLLARLEGILGPLPDWMLQKGCFTHRYFTVSGALYEQNEKSGRFEILRPKQTTLKSRVPQADEGCIDFITHLLSLDPKIRPSAQQALDHPWLKQSYTLSD